ncbi:MAG: biopolymer transporter ExbD [Chlamydiales bacterium]|jgi:biopolymer transport protein ExbD|nr:biopolymer transporter ExbD [Chlamydiales bacterium]
MRQKRQCSYQEISSEENLVNLTPLIDVVFVVLILFILIAPMVEADRVQLSSFSSELTYPVHENAVATIYVHEDNSIWLNQLRVPESQLIHYLKDLYQKQGNIPLQLFHDKRAQFGIYQSVKNAAELAGFEQLDVIVKPG